MQMINSADNVNDEDDRVIMITRHKKRGKRRSRKENNESKKEGEM